MIHRILAFVTSRHAWLNIVVFPMVLLIGQVAWSQVATFNPPYPRLHAHKMGGWETVDDPLMRVIARHNTAAFGSWRNWTASGYNPVTLSRYLKTLNPSLKLFHAANMSQVYSVGSADAPIVNKVSAERGNGGTGDWWLRTATGENITGFHPRSWRINFTEKVSADANGRKFPQWYANFLNAAATDGIDFVTSGKGLREGSWDGVYQDDQWISQGLATSAGDYDEDGTADAKTDADVRTWVMNAHKAFVAELKTLHPTWLHMANMISQTKLDEAVPASFQGINDIGFFERTTFYETTQGWAEMMVRYRRGLSYLNPSGPKIGIFDNDLESFRAAYPKSGFSDYRWNRYGLCSALMDNGSYSVHDHGSTGYKTPLWFDEMWGGSLQTVGYLGYPIDPPQVKAWSQGVFRREFDNGLVLVNPKGNGSKTVDIGLGWKRLSGLEDPVHNNGQVTTSMTLDEQDGIIFLRENGNLAPKPPEYVVE